MPVSQGRDARGQVSDVLVGSQRQQLLSGLGGKYAEYAMRGDLHFAITVAAGLAVPIQTTTAPTVGLWNPSDSGVNAVLAKFTVGYVSGTSVATPIGLVFRDAAGGSAATGANIVQWTEAAAGTNLFNGKLGRGNRPKARAIATATNTTTAGTYVYTIFGESALIATTAMNPYETSHDFNGHIVVPPGAAVWVGGTAASGALLTQQFSWIEVPE